MGRVCNYGALSKDGRVYVLPAHGSVSCPLMVVGTNYKLVAPTEATCLRHVGPAIDIFDWGSAGLGTVTADGHILVSTGRLSWGVGGR